MSGNQRSFAERSDKHLLQRSYQEVPGIDLAKSALIESLYGDLIKRSCQKTSCMELVRSSCQETSYKDTI